MSTRNRRGRVRRRTRVVLGTAAVIAIAVASPAAAAPTTTTTTMPAPQSLAGATAKAQKLELQIAANSTRADILDERYLQARNAVAAANNKIAATQQQISDTEASAARLRDQLGGRAALLYMGAGNQDPLDVDVQSVQELGSRAKYGAAAAAEDERIIGLLELTDKNLGSQRDDLEGQLAAAQDRQSAARDAQQKVASANASMQHLLDTTNADIKVLATQMENEAAAAAAKAEQDWLQHQAAKQAAAHRNTGSGSGGVGAPPPDDGGSGPVSNLPAPTAGAVKAVAYAREQLGKPYVYAGAGPDVFDCSGLTMMAWAQAGVLMEHGSQSQYDSFPHVPIDQLRPGDLVFFGDTGPTNHHVGIVVGPGVMIDAPHTGAFVELVSYFRSDLVPMGARP